MSMIYLNIKGSRPCWQSSFLLLANSRDSPRDRSPRLGGEGSAGGGKGGQEREYSPSSLLPLQPTPPLSCRFIGPPPSLPPLPLHWSATALPATSETRVPSTCPLQTALHTNLHTYKVQCCMVLYKATAQRGHNQSAATPQFFHRGYSVVMFTGSDCGGREGEMLSSL